MCKIILMVHFPFKHDCPKGNGENAHTFLTIVLRTVIYVIGKRIRDYKPFLYFRIKMPLLGTAPQQVKD